MHAQAIGTAGDVTCSALHDAAGSNIWTECDTSNPNNVSTNILLLKLAKGGGGIGRKNILVMGNQHGDEFIGYRCAWDMAQFVVANRNSSTWPTGASWASYFDHFKKFKDMTVSKLTDNANLWVVPIANPSGYHYSKVKSSWRKNRRDTTTDPNPGTNYCQINPTARLQPGDLGEIGVNLNRNWPSSDWGSDDQRTFPPGSGILANIATSRFADHYNYCGRPVGNSWTNVPVRPPICEKETEALLNLSASVLFDCVVDLHAAGKNGPEIGWSENVDTNNCYLRLNQGLHSDNETMKILAAKVAGIMQKGSTPQAGPYPVSGDTLWYHYDKASKHALTFLIENSAGYDKQPTDADGWARSALAGQLFMMFATVDKSFASRPTARFRKP